MFIHVLNNSIILSGMVVCAAGLLAAGYNFGYTQAMTRRSRQRTMVVAVPTSCKGIDLPAFLKSAKKAPKGE